MTLISLHPHRPEGDGPPGPPADETERLLDELLPLLVPEPPGRWAEILWPYEDQHPTLHDLIGPFLDELRLNAVDFFSTGMVLCNRYQLEELLGTGASSVVWRARDRVLERPVALKVFRTHLLGHHLVNALDEARSTSGLAHPNIVRIFDAQSGSSESWAYIAMELGTPLSDLRPESIEEAVRAVLHAGEGLARAHRACVFHRDVKPANLVVSEETRQVQMVDFGFHHITSDPVIPPMDDTDQPTIVPFGTRFRLGTPGFMAPEQADGEDLQWSPDDVVGRDYLGRLDVYGLGATLYALLAGRPPYQGDDVYSVLAKARRGCPEPLKARDGLAGRLDARLRRIVDKAMSPRPEDRYDTVDGFVLDLTQWLEQRPSSQDGLGWRGLLFWRRNRAILGTGAVALILMGVLGVALVTVQHRATALETQITLATGVRDAMLWQGEVIRGQLRTTVDAKQRAESQVQETTKTVTALTRDLGAAKSREGALRKEVSALATDKVQLDAQLQDLGAELTHNLELLAQTQSHLEAANDLLGERKAALTSALLEISKQEQALSDTHAALDEQRSRLAQRQGELERAKLEQQTLAAQVSRLEDHSEGYRRELQARERQVQLLTAELAETDGIVAALRSQLREKIDRLAALETQPYPPSP